MEDAAPYFVYVLRCDDGSLYTGITTNVTRRLREHLSGAAPGARYTRVHVPTDLQMVWQTQGRAAASRLEYRIKHLSAADKHRLLADPRSANALKGIKASDVFEPLTQEECQRCWRAAIAT